MPSTIWGREAAERYDDTSAAMFAPAVLNPTIDFLFHLAAGGPALEFAVGTGRVALPLAARGIEVAGIELSPHMVEQLRAKPSAGGELGRVFMMEPDHVGIDTFDDVLGQIASSHHWMVIGGRVVLATTQYRYIYPSELDLMGRCAGLALKHRWAGWEKGPFTADSTNQVVVFEKTV